MPHLCRLFSLFVFALLTSALASESSEFAAVREADQQRLNATIAGDTAKLSELLSDDLHYAHSDGRVQTKEQFVTAVASNKVKYLSFEPYDVAFQSVATGAVAMNGRARLAAQAGERRVEFSLRFLAVWRQESGHWRLLAYQSSQLTESAATESK